MSATTERLRCRADVQYGSGAFARLAKSLSNEQSEDGQAASLSRKYERAYFQIAQEKPPEDNVLRSVKRWIIAAARLSPVLLFELCVTVIPAHAAEEDARVVILNGTDPYNPAYLVIDGAMRASLANETRRRVVFLSESLDAQHFAVDALEPEFLALLVKKYRALHVDVVVANTQPALAFFTRHGEQLWPGARLVFHSIADRTINAVALPSDALGVATREDIGGTIDLARYLQPNARRILVVVGVSETDKRLEQQARQVLLTKAEPATVEFISGWPQPELVARVAAEPADSIILYLTQFRDRNGLPYTPREVLRAISTSSAAPVYGLFETYIGFGAAAGNMESFEETGHLVGQQIRAALTDGQTVPGRGVLEVPKRCLADARALERWSLDENRLPHGCEVRFADRPLWRQYWLQLVMALAIIVGQTLLIAALIAQRRRRRIAES